MPWCTLQCFCLFLISIPDSAGTAVLRWSSSAPSLFTHVQKSPQGPVLLCSFNLSLLPQTRLCQMVSGKQLWKIKIPYTFWTRVWGEDTEPAGELKHSPLCPLLSWEDGGGKLRKKHLEETDVQDFCCLQLATVSSCWPRQVSAQNQGGARGSEF